MAQTEFKPWLSWYAPNIIATKLPSLRMGWHFIYCGRLRKSSRILMAPTKTHPALVPILYGCKHTPIYSSLITSLNLSIILTDDFVCSADSKQLNLRLSYRILISSGTFIGPNVLSLIFAFTLLHHIRSRLNLWRPRGNSRNGRQNFIVHYWFYFYFTKFVWAEHWPIGRKFVVCIRMHNWYNKLYE